MAKTKVADLTEPTPPVFGEAEQAAERRSRVPRERQFPSLYGEQGIEVAERTADTDETSTDIFVKDFVTVRRDYDDGDQSGIHERNKTAVRQYMVANGLRPDAEVEFSGEHDHWDGVSVVLRYTVKAVPAVVARTFDLRHTVIPATGETGTERAEHDAARQDRLKAGHDARREGTPEADRSEGEARIAAAEAEDERQRKAAAKSEEKAKD